MPDLASELRRITEDADAPTRALPVAEVIRRGNRRRSRAIGGAAAAACLTVTIGGAVVLTGGAQVAQRPSQPVHAADVGTLTSTATGPDGRMTIWARYVPAAGGQVTVEAVRASFTYKHGYANPYFKFAFRNPRTGKIDQNLASPLDQRNDATSLVTGWITLSDAAGSHTFADGEVLTAGLRVESVSDSPGRIFTVNQVGVVLSPPLRLAWKVGSG
jgi:hypothetical protein